MTRARFRAKAAVNWIGVDRPAMGASTIDRAELSPVIRQEKRLTRLNFGGVVSVHIATPARGHQIFRSIVSTLIVQMIWPQGAAPSNPFFAPVARVRARTDFVVKHNTMLRNPATFTCKWVIQRTAFTITTLSGITRLRTTSPGAESAVTALSSPSGCLEWFSALLASFRQALIPTPSGSRLAVAAHVRAVSRFVRAPDFKPKQCAAGATSALKHGQHGLDPNMGHLLPVNGRIR
jgi:hypothetical protein